MVLARRDHDRTDSGGKRAPDAEAYVLPTAFGGVKAPAGRAEPSKIVVKGTAAVHAEYTATSLGPHYIHGPGRSVRGRPIVVVVVAILDPLPNIAVHVVEPKRIRRE